MYLINVIYAIVSHPWQEEELLVPGYADGPGRPKGGPRQPETLLRSRGNRQLHLRLV
jgi:hypothetical protein